ncbi:MAG: AbrB/MazE/SpoVT family DNA-binding domain-containing protein [Allorhizobium sp.]
MAVTTKVRKQGGAAVVTIPPALLKLMAVEVGDQLSLNVQNGELVATPLKAGVKRYTLAELLVGAEELNQLNASLADTMDGDAVGREIG